MMSVEYIRQLSNEQARKARQEARLPYVPDDAREIRESWGSRCPVTNLGSYCPKGWRQVRVEDDEYQRGINGPYKAWLVDKTGMGDESEPAWTIRGFVEDVAKWCEDHPTHGYAIIEEGQFQIVIAAFEPVKKKTRKAS